MKPILPVASVPGWQKRGNRVNASDILICGSALALHAGNYHHPRQEFLKIAKYAGIEIVT